jgi:type II secretory pathway pseudopilin PulG
MAAVVGQEGYSRSPGTKARSSATQGAGRQVEDVHGRGALCTGMKLNATVQRNQRGRSAFTLVEAMVSVLIMSVLTAGIAGAFSSGIGVVETERENLRATQILMQKTEAIRLMTWNQGTNTTLAPTTFTDWYDPTGTNTQSAGATYTGNFSVVAAPTNVPGAYRSSMRLVTATVYWTNYPPHGRPPIVHSRQMQTQVARYGMQNYIYK